MALIYRPDEQLKEFNNYVTKYKLEYILNLLEQIEETVRSNHHNVERKDSPSTALCLAKLGFLHSANLVFDSFGEQEALARELGIDYFKKDR